MENKEKENEIEMTAREIASEIKSALLSDPEIVNILSQQIAMKLKWYFKYPQETNKMGCKCENRSYNNPMMGMNMGMSGMDMHMPCMGMVNPNPMPNGNIAFLEIVRNEFIKFKDSIIEKYGKINNDFKDDLTKFECRVIGLVAAENNLHNF